MLSGLSLPCGLLLAGVRAPVGHGLPDRTRMHGTLDYPPGSLQARTRMYVFSADFVQICAGVGVLAADWSIWSFLCVLYLEGK